MSATPGEEERSRSLRASDGIQRSRLDSYLQENIIVFTAISITKSIPHSLIRPKDVDLVLA